MASCPTRIFFTLVPADTHSSPTHTHAHTGTANTAIRRDRELKSAPQNGVESVLRTSYAHEQRKVRRNERGLWGEWRVARGEGRWS